MQNIFLCNIILVMEHKYLFLLRNLPVQHTFVIMDANIKKQLRKLNELGVFSYFILGRLETIKRVLVEVEKLHYFTKKFAWFAITQNSGNLSCNCLNSSIIHIHPINDLHHQTLHDPSYYSSEYKITENFYFHLILNSILAMR